MTGLLPPLRAIPSHSSLATFASILSAGKSVRHPFGKDTDAADKAGTERWVYAHLIQTSGYKNPDTQAGQPGAKGEARIKLNGGLELEEGDGVFVRGGKVGECEWAFFFLFLSAFARTYALFPFHTQLTTLSVSPRPFRHRIREHRKEGGRVPRL